jgi:hypothetical protein
LVVVRARSHALTRDLPSAVQAEYPVAT